MKADRNSLPQRRRGSAAPLRRKVIAVLVAACYSSAYAGPTNPTVAAGQASFALQGKTYSITNTPNTIINWQGFSLASDEIARFIQQSADSRVLNRITGQDPSVILGSLQSNGKVFLINPNGVMFGAGSRVDVNGLVASSLAISNADFLAGKNNYTGAADAGKVSNAGTITTPAGGQIFLIAPAVENSGIMSSPNGDVVLAAGHSVQLFDSSDPNVQVVVSSAADQALNLGQIVAQGGRVGVYGALVNQRGAINANSAVRGANGKIILKSSGTTLLEAGSTTTATGSNLNTGGDIQLLGDKVGLTGNAMVDASGAAGGGTVLVGGDYQGKNPAIQNATQTYVARDSVIKADATGLGDGGKVIVWGDKTTQVYGSISARGGAQGGNGGFVETSGAYLDMQGMVDTRAPNGASGRLLLDPSDVYIADNISVAGVPGSLGNVNLLGGPLFVESGAVGDSLLLSSVLQTVALNADVTISTHNTNSISAPQNGSIYVLSPIDLHTSAGNHILTLAADNNIVLAADVNNIHGALSMAAGGAISQSGGVLTLSSLNAAAVNDITLNNTGNTISGLTALTSTSGNVQLKSVNVRLDASSAGGSFSATAYNGDMSIEGNVNSGGNITLTSNKTNGSMTLNSGKSLTSSTGNITLQSDGMALNGTISGIHEVRLTPNLDATNIVIGGAAADATGVLGLSQAELSNITLPANGLLTIGGFGSSTGSLTVTGNLNLATAQNGAGLLLQTQSGALNINAGTSLAANGVISLQTLPSGDHRVTNAGSITSGSGINIFSGKMTLADGTLTASSVSLESSNPINLGATGNPADTLALTNADLNSAHTGALNISINSSHIDTGDIVVSAPVAVNNLSLTAQRNMDLAASVTTSQGLSLSTVGAIAAEGDVSVGGKFELISGSWRQVSGSLPAFSASDFQLTGGTFVRALSGDGLISTPYQLTDVYGLQGAATLSSSNSYVLANDIDASGTANWGYTLQGQATFYKGFRPLAQNGVYTGVFDGASHSIADLMINLPSGDNVGLFSQVATGTIRDLNLTGAQVTGHSNVGGLAGSVSFGIGLMTGVNVDGQVTGLSNVGGLVGDNGGLISSSTSSGIVNGISGTGSSNIGGLAGRNRGSIDNSSSSVDVSNHGDGYTGGLVGVNTNESSGVGSIVNSYASGSVYSPGEIVGGLVGDNRGGSIATSYAAGAVQGGRNVGGLAGRNTDNGTITDAYATGDVSGDTTSGAIHANMGGLVGDFFNGTITNVFSIGVIDGSNFSSVHGLLGQHENGTLSNGYFNLDTAGIYDNGTGGTALTSQQMQQQDSYVGFDFSSAPVWRIYENHTTPLLKSLLTPITINVTGGSSMSKDYDGTSVDLVGASAGSLPGSIMGTLGWDGAVNAGTYGVSGLFSTKYDISYGGTNPQLTINPRVLNATLTAGKVYDGQTLVESSSNYHVSFSNVVGGDTVAAYGAVNFTDNSNAGTGKPVSMTNPTLSNNDLGNYVLNGPITGIGTINPRGLALTDLVIQSSRVYNSSDVANITSGGNTIEGGLGSDDVTLNHIGTATAHFDNKSAGTGKLVTVDVSGYTLQGAKAGNYVVVGPTGLTGDVTPAPLTLTGVTAVDRVYNVTYDAGSSQYGTGVQLNTGSSQPSGVFAGDIVTVSGIKGAFADRNAGNAKPVTVTATLGGMDGANYSFISPASLTASITPAPLTVSLNSHEYNNSATASFGDAALNGVLGMPEGPLDTVALVTGSATAVYADKNVGINKIVTVSGGPLSLSGSDAGNYMLAGVTGTITARALSTWIGGGSGLWSDAGNWQDGIAPDGANVLAATLSGAGTVTYDGGQDHTALTTLTTLTMAGSKSLQLTGGTLALTGLNTDASVIGSGSTLTVGGTGNLSLAGKLTVNNMVLNGGVISGASTGYLDVSSLSRTGGSIDMDGALNWQTGGNIVMGATRAQAGITLTTVESGAISQTGALVTNVLDVHAVSGVTLTDTGNRVNRFNAVNTTGNIALTNTVASGELALGAISTTGNIIIDNHGGIHTVGNIAATGQVSITAHSPITIDNAISGSDIGLSASSDITLGSTSALNSGHSVSLTAGGGIVLGGYVVVPANGSITAVAATGSISTTANTHIDSGGAPVTLSALQGSVNTSLGGFYGGTVPIVNDGSAAAAAAAAKAAADASAKAAADAAAKAAADAAAKAAADAAAKAAADAAAKAAADAASAAAAKAAADAAAKAAADAAAQAAADAAAKAAADAAAKAAADAAAKAAADAAAKAAADAAAQAAADAAAKAAADAAAQAAAAAAAKAAADAAAAAAAAAAGQNQQTQPITQALNSTVNIINTAVNASTSNVQGGAHTVPPLPQSDNSVASNSGSGGGGSSGSAKQDDKTPDSKDAKKDDASTTQVAKKDDTAKKMYCN